MRYNDTKESNNGGNENEADWLGRSFHHLHEFGNQYADDRRIYGFYKIKNGGNDNEST